MQRVGSVLLGAAIVAGALGCFTACKEEGRTKYDIKANYAEETRTLSCEMTAIVPNRTKTALEELPFALWANAFREGARISPVSELYAPAAYYDGPSYGGVTVTKVEGAAGYEVGGEDENILFVTLQEPLYPGESVTLGFSFEVMLPKLDFRFGAGENTVDLTHFYPELCAYGEGGFLEHVYSPTGDPFVSECADFSLELTFPAGYEAAFGGSGTVTSSGAEKRLSMTAEGVRDIAVVLGRGLKVLAAEGGMPVEFWYFKDETPERTLKIARDSLAYFSRTFGDYAFPKYVVVETDLPFGGMEYSGLAMISSSLQAGEVAEVVAHETAHQWWYASVGSDQFSHAWQDEGLAEYSAALFLGAYGEYGGSYGEAVARSERAYRAFFSVQSQLEKAADTSMDRPLTTFGSLYEYRNIAYDKGVILFDRVRMVLGERKFFAGLKAYAADCAGRLVSPAKLIACFQKAGGKAEELFASFTEGRCVI